MCIILDANLYGDFFNPCARNHAEMKPAYDWLHRKGGKIAYSSTPKFEQEAKGVFRKNFAELRRANKIKRFDEQKVLAKQRELPSLQSDDPHIIALALVADVKLLISKDQRLHEDFKDLCKGKVYQQANHSRLLKPDLCP